MRQLLFSFLVAAAALARPAAAQATGSEVTLFLLLPTGAQAVGMGQAMVAAKPGSEGIWWNPASLAGQEKRELAIHYSSTISGTSDAFSFVIPSKSHGTVGLTLSVLDLGEQELRDDNNNLIGLALPR